MLIILMTLEFKLLCAVFLIFLTSNAFKLHDSNAFIDEGAREDDFWIESDPLHMEKGVGLHASTSNKEIVRRWTDRMLMDQPRALRARKLREISDFRQPKKRLSALAVNARFPPKSTRITRVVRPHERRLAEPVHSIRSQRKRMKISKDSIDIAPKSYVVKAKRPQARKLADRSRARNQKRVFPTFSKHKVPVRQARTFKLPTPAKRFKISNSASFLRMKHDREQRFRQMNIKVVPPHALTPRQRLLQQSKTLVHQAKKAKKLKINPSKGEGKAPAKKTKNKKSAVKKEAVVAPPAQTLPIKATAPTEEQTAHVLNQAKQVAQVLSQVVNTPAGQPLAQILSPAISAPAVHHFAPEDRTLDDEEKRAQNFVNDLQTQVRQTKLAVEGIQDKLIVIKENEGEIKAMLARLLRDRNMIV